MLEAAEIFLPPLNISTSDCLTVFLLSHLRKANFIKVVKCMNRSKVFVSCFLSYTYVHRLWECFELYKETVKVIDFVLRHTVFDTKFNNPIKYSPCSFRFRYFKLREGISRRRFESKRFNNAEKRFRTRGFLENK